jgi:serine kinase of HPr protein (carbohydrate metabolism regulator)
MSETLNPNKTTQNYHACLIRLEGKGVLITGPSGSGKTSLMMGLLETFDHAGKEALFVCDDRVSLTFQNGTLVGTAPKAIEGKAEIYGYGILDLANISDSKIDLMVQLCDEEDIERMPEPEYIQLLKVELPIIKVPRRHENQSVRIILAKLTSL